MLATALKKFMNKYGSSLFCYTLQYKCNDAIKIQSPCWTLLLQRSKVEKHAV